MNRNGEACEIIEIGKKFYVLDGWDGRVYNDAFECLTKTKMAEDGKKYTIKPIFRYETESGRSMMETMFDLDESSDEWKEKYQYLIEPVSYRVSEN